MKRFIFKFGILLVFVLSTIIGLNYIYQRKMVNFGTMGIHKNDSAYVSNVPSNIEVANFGNSHGYYGFNYEKLGDKYVCFNFSLPSQSMSYNYLIMDNYKDRFKSGGVVYLCISYHTFFGKSEVERPGFYSKNRRYYKFLDEKHIKQYSHNYDFYVNYFPVLIENPISLIKKIVVGNESSKDYWNVGTDREKAKKHGDARTKGWIGINSKPQIVNLEEVDATYKMIELCKELGMTVIMITTPYLQEYTDPIVTYNPKFYDVFYSIIN